MNIVLFGALMKALELPDIDREEIIRSTVRARFIDMNNAAYRAGHDAIIG